MSYKYREPREPEEYMVCDICGGEMDENDGMCHPDNSDLNFHTACWENAPQWAKDCPSSLFNDETPYGEYVEAARTGKCVLFIEGEDRCPAICENRKDAEDYILEMDMSEEEVEGIVINGEFHKAYTVVKIHIEGIDDED